MTNLLIHQNTAKTMYSRMQYKVRSFLALHPELFFPLIQLKSTSRKLAVGKHTELVIEGFPRSANSFAVGAFKAAQLNPVSVATHLHAPAQIILAARKNIPTLVLIRRPTDAVVSLRSLDLEVNSSKPSRARNFNVEHLLKNYIHFYTSIMPYKDKYVLGCFEEVTSNFGSVIKRINERYNTNFALFEHTEESMKKVFQGQGIHAAPSSKRQEIKAIVSQEIETSKAKALVSEAENIYNQLKQMICGVKPV